MSMRFAQALLAVVALSFVSLPAWSGDAKVEGDLKKIQGKWTAEAGNGGKTTYTFDGSKLKVEAPTRTYEMTITIDEKAKPEPSIDFKIDEAPEDAKGKTCKGIYKFNGEKFVFCFRAMGERPEKFEMIGFEQIVVTLSKEKK
jgi:uncharacterized protein (TIGR03067 family)